MGNFCYAADSRATNTARPSTRGVRSPCRWCYDNAVDGRRWTVIHSGGTRHCLSESFSNVRCASDRTTNRVVNSSTCKYVAWPILSLTTGDDDVLGIEVFTVAVRQWTQVYPDESRVPLSVGSEGKIFHPVVGTEVGDSRVSSVRLVRLVIVD